MKTHILNPVVRSRGQAVNWLPTCMILLCLPGIALGQSETAPTEQPQSPSAVAPADLQGTDRATTIDTLVGEVDLLTPGGISNDAKLKEGVTSAVRAFIDGDAAGTYEQLERLRLAHSKLPPTSLVIAALHFTTGNVAEGARQLEDAANASPNLPKIYNAFARIAISQGRKTDARVLLEKSQTLIKENKWSAEDLAYFEKMHADAMADLLILRDDFGSAREFLEALLKNDPNMSKSIMRLAQIDFRQGKIEDCLKRLEEFRRLTPDSRVPELMLATLLAQTGDESSAENWVVKALEKYPAEQPVVLEYLDWMVAHENFEKADELLQRMEVKIGSLPAVLMLKGKMAFARQEYEQAEKLFSTLRTSEPTNAEVSTMLALSMAELNDPEKLQKAMEIAGQNVQLQPRNPTIMAVLGYLFLKSNNLPAAGEWLNRSTQSGTIAAESAFYIAEFLNKQGDKARALELVNTSLENRGLFLYRQPALQLKKQLSDKDESLTPPVGDK